MNQLVKFSAVLSVHLSFHLSILGCFTSAMATPTLVDQWLTHSIERREWKESLSEPSRHDRAFDARHEIAERDKMAHRITDGILRNTVQDLIQLSAPKTAATIKNLTEAVGNRRTVIAENSDSPSEIRYGYNLFEDTARAQWTSARRSFGVQLENVIVWDDPRRIMRVRCFADQKLDSSGTTAHASYSSGERSVSLALGRPLSRDVSARLELISLHRGGANLAFAQAGVTFVIQNTSL